MSDIKETSQEGHNSDPNLVGPEDTHNIGMKGEGAPGSHSAVFGLTPDGKKDDNTSSGSTMTKVKEGVQSAIGGGTSGEGEDTNNTSSTSAGSGSVAGQMKDSTLRSGGQGGPEGHAGAGAGDKPGSGFDGPSQGTGEVGGGATNQGGGLMEKVKSYVSGS